MLRFAPRRREARIREFARLPWRLYRGDPCWTDAVLFRELHEYAAFHGYTQGEASRLLEDNEMVIRPSTVMGGREYKAVAHLREGAVTAC